MRFFIFRVFLLAVLWCVAMLGQAQGNRVYSQEVKSLTAKINDDWRLPPVLLLGADDYLSIDFDILSHEVCELAYHVVHCNADWSESELFEIDFLDGFNDMELRDYSPSVNTTVDYTHYRLSLPNEDTRLKASGNYKIQFIDTDNGEVLAETCFSIVERKVNVAPSVTSNTDIDTNKSHQQVEFTVSYSGYEIRYPQNEVSVCVVQNRRFDAAVSGIQPTYLGNRSLEYTHQKALIFDGGNEYRRFEMLNENDAMMGVEDISYYQPYYHVTLYPDAPARNYNFDSDQDGLFIIRNNNVGDTDVEADYMLVHFCLEADENFGDVFVDGAFAYGDCASEPYRMTYNAEKRFYEKTLLLKQGLYNYQYASRMGGGKTSLRPIEGSFYETENEYLIYVYHRPFGERADRLVGFSRIEFK